MGTIQDNQLGVFTQTTSNWKNLPNKKETNDFSTAVSTSFNFSTLKLSIPPLQLHTEAQARERQ
jgi:hypothetical protein